MGIVSRRLASIIDANLRTSLTNDQCTVGAEYMDLDFPDIRVARSTDAANT